MKYMAMRHSFTGVIFSGIVFILSCSQISESRDMLGKTWASKELKSALSDSPQHNVINSKHVVLDNKKKVIEFAEQILFDIYGRQQIESQKPYEIYSIDGYWIIRGTLPKDSVGGTFLIIINSLNCQIIRLTHGK